MIPILVTMSWMLNQLENTHFSTVLVTSKHIYNFGVKIFLPFGIVCSCSIVIALPPSLL